MSSLFHTTNSKSNILTPGAIKIQRATTHIYCPIYILRLVLNNFFTYIKNKKKGGRKGRIEGEGVRNRYTEVGPVAV